MGKIMLNGVSYGASGSGGGTGDYADKNIYGDNALSMGRKSGTAVGENSFAFGNFLESSGNFSHAEGLQNKASGAHSHAEGLQSEATGESAHAEGRISRAKGFQSHAEGEMTTASGSNSHAEGAMTTASGSAAHSEGQGTVANNSNSHAGGKFNKIMEENDSNGQLGDAFVIGNGTGTSNRSNAMRVTFSGDIMGTKAFQSSGADYAEFIRPWADGNPDSEDRVGYFVTIKDELLQKADSCDYIVGITSGNPSVVGNADEDYYWRYERDAFNRIVMEDVPELAQKVDEDGNLLFNEETHEPIMEETGNIILNARMKLAEDYDLSLQQSYIPRAERQEWDYVGMVGVLPVRDDGTCIPGNLCKCGQGGIATFAEERGFDTYMVIERISDNVVSVILK